MQIIAAGPFDPHAPAFLGFAAGFRDSDALYAGQVLAGQ